MIFKKTLNQVVSDITSKMKKMPKITIVKSSIISNSGEEFETITHQRCPIKPSSMNYGKYSFLLDFLINANVSKQVENKVLSCNLGNLISDLSLLIFLSKRDCVKEKITTFSNNYFLKDLTLKEIIDQTNETLKRLYKFSIFFDEYGQIDVKIPNELLPDYNQKLEENKKLETEYNESHHNWITKGIRV